MKKRKFEFILLVLNKLFSYLRSYKQFSPELETADGKHTQTESMTRNDVAVNTGKYFLKT
jgi:hypothetical protein